MVYTQPGAEYTTPEEITRILGLPQPPAVVIQANVVATDTLIPLLVGDIAGMSVGDEVEISDPTNHPYTELRTITAFNEAGGVWSIQVAAVTYDYAVTTGRVRLISAFQPTPTGTMKTTRRQVDALIIQNQEYINERTHHAWYADGKQVRRLWLPFTKPSRHWHYPSNISPGMRWDTYYYVNLPDTHIKVFDEDLDDSLKIHDGSSWTEWIGVMTEWDADTAITGRVGDYWVDYASGIIFFLNHKPTYTDKGVYVTYRHGGDYTSQDCSGDISKACALLTAIDVIRGEPYAMNFPANMDEQKGGLMMKSLIKSWQDEVESIIARRRRIFTYYPQ